MADNGKTVRKIRQGKVDIDYEESTLVIHYDLELVSIFHYAFFRHSASMTLTFSNLALIVAEHV